MDSSRPPCPSRKLGGWDEHVAHSPKRLDMPGGDLAADRHLGHSQDDRRFFQFIREAWETIALAVSYSSRFGLVCFHKLTLPQT